MHVMQAHDSLRHAPNINLRRELGMNRIDEDHPDADSDSFAASSNNSPIGKATAEKVSAQFLFSFKPESKAEGHIHSPIYSPNSSM